MATIQALQHLIYTHPLIDNHAHNILKSPHATNYDKFPFEAITSEAQGDALIPDVRKSLAHLKALTQLAGFYNCAPELEAIKAARDEAVKSDYEGLVKRCLHGTHMLLLDDGLNVDDVEPYSWHDRFMTGPTKRIVRIESLAATVMQALAQNELETLTKTWAGFQQEFGAGIDQALNDPDVVGFKSVICYRTGLNIEQHPEDDIFDAFNISFRRVLDDDHRIDMKPFNDFLVIFVLEKLQENMSGTGKKKSKPIQFHTGLGDADIRLTQSSAAHMQPLIEKYKSIDFVLLHSSYPFTRESGYLASVYRNAYLDVGEVFPMVSRDGQMSILRECFELVPTSKILWSTDGHYHPETFWLANYQFRRALYLIFEEYIHKGDLNLAQAMNSAKDILFNNSNNLYSLEQVINVMPSSDIDLDDLPQLFYQWSHKNEDDVDTARRFISGNRGVNFIWIQWVDYTATVRVRMVTTREFINILAGKRLGIALASMNMLQNDLLVAPDALIAGQFYLRPDVTTLSTNGKLLSSSLPSSATVMAFWHTEDGQRQRDCPRTMLQNITDKCETEFDISLLLGFEVEVIFMKKHKDGKDGVVTFKPLLETHSWSNMTLETQQVLPLLENIVNELSSRHIHLEQFHTESCPAQFEFVLPPSNPLAAVDTLIKARQIITQLAHKQDIHVTLYPRPFPNSAGNAAHAHISITPPTQENSFLAGMLEHLPSVLAFTLPQDASYARVTPGIWAGGEWVAWGEQNRETPIRKIEPGHWELKSMDGLANPYLGMAALIGAGYLGLYEGKELGMKACNSDPASLSLSALERLGVTTRLPRSLDESIAVLELDSKLRHLLGRNFVKRYISVLRGGQIMLDHMSEEDRRNWLIERY